MKKEELFDFESEKVWEKVNLALKKGDEEEGLKYKENIEENQRKLEKQRLEIDFR
jgi:hypothetical protein